MADIKKPVKLIFPNAKDSGSHQDKSIGIAEQVKRFEQEHNGANILGVQSLKDVLEQAEREAKKDNERWRYESSHNPVLAIQKAAVRRVQAEESMIKMAEHMDTEKELDLSVWGAFSSYSLSDAAWLWCNLEPSEHEPPAVVKRAKYEIKCNVKPMDSISQYAEVGSIVTVHGNVGQYSKQTLFDYAQKIGHIPVFLQSGVNSDYLKPDGKNADSTKTKPKKTSSRTTNLKKVVLNACKYYGQKPSFAELIKYIQDELDEDNIIQDWTNEKVTWITTKGEWKDTKNKTLKNMLADITYP